MLARTLLNTVFLGAIAATVADAAPAVEVQRPPQPATVTIQKHVLAAGAKPRNPARYARISGSESLKDYYLGTDLQ